MSNLSNAPRAERVRVDVWDTTWAELPSEARGVDIPAIAVAPSGLVYAFARAAEPIIALDRAGSVLKTWGHGTFRRPHGLHVTASEVICVDDAGHQVRAYTLEGEHAWTIEGADQTATTHYRPGFPHSVATAAPPFCYPTGAATSGENDLFVSDGYGNARVHRFTDRDLAESWGQPGTAPGEFVLPHNVMVFGETLFVSDRENERVQLLDLEGRPIGEWRNVNCPNGVAVLPGGLFVVAELGRQWPLINGRKVWDDTGLPPRVTVRDWNGDVISDITPPPDLVDPRWFAPHGIAADREGHVYISEVKWGYSGGDAPAHVSAITRIMLRGLEP